jgi:hypothetical protein
MNLGYGRPNRSETLRFLMELDKARADKFRGQLTTLGSQVGAAAGTTQEGDTLKVTYTLNVTYFGDAVRCLEALKDILSDPAVLVKADLHELQHGECVIAAVLDRLRAAQATIRQRG